MSFDYVAILKRSFEVVKKNKWLLVYGLLLAGSGGGSGGGGGGSGDSSFQEIKKLFEDDPGGIPEKASQVLGTFTSTLGQWLGSINPLQWLLLIIGILLLVIVAITIGLILQAWAKGSLISGVGMALDDQKVDLKNTSPEGISKIKNIVIFSTLMFLIVIGLLITLPAIWLIVFFVVKSIEILKITWIILGVIAGGIIFIGSLLLFAMISIYAERLIVLKDYEPWEAWKKALAISRKSFLANFVMGIINMITTTTVGCLGTIILLIGLGIPAFLLLFPSINNHQFPTYSLFPLLVLVLLFVLAISVLRAALVVFTYSNWNQIFTQVLSETDKSS